MRIRLLRAGGEAENPPFNYDIDTVRLAAARPHPARIRTRINSLPAKW